MFFRVLQPHAFEGTAIMGTARFLGVLPFNEGWMEDIGEARRQVSGEADIASGKNPGNEA